MKHRIKKLACALLALALTGSAAMADTEWFGKDAGEGWYQDMMAAAQLSLGNNVRLKKVIERAQAGETITIATIGGSITEGAGASRYTECWASRLAIGFRARWGTGNNVKFVNAGVGGTPSTFGLMRYDRDIVARVEDDDGLPDLVVIEYAVNDGGEPTKHRCYESLVKKVLSQPNEPAVILLFSVFESGYTLQDELKKVGETYDLMMVSMRDSAFPHVGKEWTVKQFFSDEYHPTSLGHAAMADCILGAIEASAAKETDAADIDLDAAPAYGTDFMGLRTIYADTDYPDLAIDRGGFMHDDAKSYANLPVGRVCGPNFFKDSGDPAEPLRLTATFKNLLVAWRATSGNDYGRAEIRVDGRIMAIVGGGQGKWGQSEVVLAYDAPIAAEHEVEIRMTSKTQDRKFTITCLGITQ